MSFLKRGKKTRAWDAVRRKLKERFLKMNVTRCEQCNAAYPLGFAHRYKRRHITDQTELETCALLCNPCHERIEYGGNMYAEISQIIEKRNEQIELYS